MNPGVESLGEIRHTFRPKMANIVAGAILGLALLVGGISLAVYVVRRPDPKPLDTGNRIGKYAIIGMLGIGAPVGGIALLVWMKRLAAHRVTVHEHGFSYVYAGTTEICLWTEVAKIDEVFTEEQLKVLKLPGAAIKNVDHSFVVHRKDGKEFAFTVNSIDSIPRLTECLEAARDKHNLAWQRIQQ